MALSSDILSIAHTPPPTEPLAMLGAAGTTAVLLLLLLAAVAAGGVHDIPRYPALLSGGGNLGHGDRANATWRQQYSILRGHSAFRARLNIYPGDYVNESWSNPITWKIESSLLQAAQDSVEVIILFEYYASYFPKSGLGSWDQWYKIGHAFASRFGPGGTFSREHGLNGGVRFFSAFNEPDDNTGFCDKPGKVPGPGPYLAALSGLAAGVHAFDPSLTVLPGGFMSPNAFGDYTLCGLGPLLAPLYNNGSLSAIDLHTYFDVQYAPMIGTYRSSANNCFHEVKARSGVTADVAFVATEYNYKLRNVTEEEAAQRFLTALWDHLGVVGNAKQPVTAMALVWNLFQTPQQSPPYGLATSFDPYEPRLRATVLWRTLNLTAEVTLISSDPWDTGVLHLSDPKSLFSVVVFQNLPKWSSLAGDRFMLQRDWFPSAAHQVEMHGWDGLRRKIPLSGTATIDVAGLSSETVMFFASALGPP